MTYVAQKSWFSAKSFFWMHQKSTKYLDISHYERSDPTILWLVESNPTDSWQLKSVPTNSWLGSVGEWVISSTRGVNSLSVVSCENVSSVANKVHQETINGSSGCPPWRKLVCHRKVLPGVSEAFWESFNWFSSSSGQSRASCCLSFPWLSATFEFSSSC